MTEAGRQFNLVEIVQEKYAGSNLLLPSPGQNAADIPKPLVEQFVSAPLPRASGLALVDDWDCLRVGFLADLYCL